MRYVFMVLACVLLAACSNDKEMTGNKVATSFNFTHHWDGTEVTHADFNTIKFTNALGQQMSIERLRYLISGITFQKANGETFVLEDHILVDVANGTNLTYTPETLLPSGSYANLSFIFGFANEDNIDGAYADLNTALWNVPGMLGGGYHYMQLEGKFVNASNTETGYQYHAIRAVDTTGPGLKFQDTFFKVDLGEVVVEDGVSFEITMNIAQWFKDPNEWDLNALHAMLMPDFEAQLMISENGRNVFGLKEADQQ